MKKQIMLASMLIGTIITSGSCFAGGFNVLGKGRLNITITLQDGTSFQPGLDFSGNTYITVNGPVQTITAPGGRTVPQASLDLINQKLNNAPSQAATIFIYSGFNVIGRGPVGIAVTLQDGTSFQRGPFYQEQTYISIDGSGPIQTINALGVIVPQATIDLINQKLYDEPSQAATINLYEIPII